MPRISRRVRRLDCDSIGELYEAHRGFVEHEALIVLCHRLFAQGDVDFWVNGWFPLHNEYEDAYAQGVAAQRPFYFDHLAELTDLAMAEYAALTGRWPDAEGHGLPVAPRIELGVGLIKGDRWDWLIEKAVEAGRRCDMPVMVDFWPRPPERWAASVPSSWA